MHPTIFGHEGTRCITALFHEFLAQVGVPKAKDVFAQDYRIRQEEGISFANALQIRYDKVFIGNLECIVCEAKQRFIKLFVIPESGVIAIFDKRRGADWKWFLNTKASASMDFLAFIFFLHDANL
jgi:hypothetical protein